MLLYVIRHAQSEGNVRLPGATIDCHLTELGRRQAAAVAERVAQLGIDRLLSSPYTRALETAEAVRAATDAPAEVVPLLHEHHIDAFPEEWPLMSPETLRNCFPHFAVPEAFTASAWHRPPETHLEALRRAAAVLQYMQERFADAGKQRIALVTHGSPAGKLVLAFQGVTNTDNLTVTIDNASLTVLEQHDGWRWVRAVNRVDHLGPLATGYNM